jgi:hypothetical protein
LLPAALVVGTTLIAFAIRRSMRATPVAIVVNSHGSVAGTAVERPAPDGLAQAGAPVAVPGGRLPAKSAEAEAEADAEAEDEALQACSTPACLLLRQTGTEPGTGALRQVQRAGKETDEVMRECEGGQVDACLAMVAHFDTQPKGTGNMPVAFRERAVQQLDRQCAAGDVASCLESVAFSTAQVRARRNQADAEIDCNGGSYVQCFWLAESLSQSTDSAEQAKASAFDRRAVTLAASRCDAADVSACLMLQTYYSSGKRIAPDRPKATLYLERARSIAASERPFPP